MREAALLYEPLDVNFAIQGGGWNLVAYIIAFVLLYWRYPVAKRSRLV